MGNLVSVYCRNCNGVSRDSTVARWILNFFIFLQIHPLRIRQVAIPFLGSLRRYSANGGVLNIIRFY